MKINRMEILPVSIPYKTPTKTTRGGSQIGHHVLVRLFTDEGITGLGESSTLSVFAKAQQGAVISQLHDYFAQFVLGQDPFDIENIMNHFQVEILGTEGYISLTAVASISDALYDIMGKKCGVPVHKLLGGAFRKKIGVGRSISVKSPSETAEDAIRLKGMGYKLLTIKVGTDSYTDILRVKEVRKAVGDAFPIEVDVNQGYTPTEAIRTIRKMEEYNILNVEQPCPGWDLDGMAEVTRGFVPSGLDAPLPAVAPMEVPRALPVGLHLY